MRNLLMRFSLVLLSLILLPSFASGQRGGAGFGGRGRPPATPSTEPFDPHDFNGIWWRTGGTREFNTQKGGEPQLTPERNHSTRTISMAFGGVPVERANSTPKKAASRN